MSNLKSLLRRDLCIVWQTKHQCLEALVFYVIANMLFAVNDALTPTVIWITALLATILGLMTIFKHDYDSGTFGYLLLSDTPFPLLILGKTAVHWLATQVPLIIITPLLISDLSAPEILVLLATLTVGTVTLSLVGCIGAALTVGLAQSGILLSILLLPLYIPVLVLATTCSSAIAQGLPYTGHLALLAALALGAVCLAPFAASAAIKVNLR